METLAVPEAVVDRGSSKAPLGALRLARIATVQEHVARAHIRRRHESPWNVELLAASVVAGGYILKSANFRGPIVELREPDGGVIFAHLPVEAGDLALAPHPKAVVERLRDQGDQLGVGGQDAAAFAGGEALRGVKAHHHGDFAQEQRRGLEYPVEARR